MSNKVSKMKYRCFAPGCNNLVKERYSYCYDCWHKKIDEACNSGPIFICGKDGEVLDPVINFIEIYPRPEQYAGYRREEEMGNDL